MRSMETCWRSHRAEVLVAPAGEEFLTRYRWSGWSFDALRSFLRRSPRRPGPPSGLDAVSFSAVSRLRLSRLLRRRGFARERFAPVWSGQPPHPAVASSPDRRRPLAARLRRDLERRSDRPVRNPVNATRINRDQRLKQCVQVACSRRKIVVTRSSSLAQVI